MIENEGRVRKPTKEELEHVKKRKPRNYYTTRFSEWYDGTTDKLGVVDATEETSGDALLAGFWRVVRNRKLEGKVLVQSNKHKDKDGILLTRLS